ncbi:MAG: AraC family transcriptional regulator [Lachnospiraceae bacterium]|nr:AraC family transcriptional regulator [Lachnospiraceae bacterium]
MNGNAIYCSTFNLDSSETVAYNNPLFPAYVRYGILSSYPDYSAVSHWHEDLEFIVIKKGSMTYNVNGELIELPEGSGIMVNSRQLHYGFSPEYKECEFVCILLSPKLLSGNEWFYQNYIESVTKNSSYPYLYLVGEEWKISILEKIDRLYSDFASQSKQELPYFALVDMFLSIMKTLYENLDVTPHGSLKELNELSSLRNMITYIEEHFTQRITLESIASAGACCKSRCSLLFKRYLRETPMTYIAKLRLRKSLDALLNSDKSITDIAYECGFCGASYYCETFQKYYGISPLKYRKAQSRIPHH